MIINHKKFLELLPSLHNICKVTAELQIKHHKKNIIFSTKSNQTPVTEVDIQSSLIITNGLKSLTPEIPIVSEEDYDDTLTYDYFWLVDPLDGTRDYINNGNNFCICISLISDNLPIYEQDSETDDQARFLHVKIENINIICLYLPNGNPAPGPKYDYKINWMRRLVKYTQMIYDTNEPLILGGDFNVIQQKIDCSPCAIDSTI